MSKSCASPPSSLWPLPELLRASDAAALLGLDETKFEALADAGGIGPRPVKLGQLVRWPREELVAWARHGCPRREHWCKGATEIEPELLRTPEAAALLGVSRRHFQSMAAAGKVGPMPVPLGDSVRWSRSEVLLWIASGCPGRERWSKREGKRKTALRSGGTGNLAKT